MQGGSEWDGPEAEVMKRRETRQIKVGGVRIGGGSPVSIQSMTKVETSDVKALVAQIKRLEKAGCEIVRVAVKNFKDASAVKSIKRKIKIPLVCDIHFNYKLAIEAIKNGADKIRLNPGNIRKRDEVAQVVKAAKRAKIPIRIGLNSGSVLTNDERPLDFARGRRTTPARLRSDYREAGGNDERISSELVNSAMRCIRLFEELAFRDIIISLKASDVVTTVEAYRRIARLCDYPLHLGVTAAGPYDEGIVKSSIGIGGLLLDGIGDTIRVSLTSDPVDEVIAAKRILAAVGARNFGPDIISCPLCGRCQVDLIKIVKELESKLFTIHHSPFTKRPLRIAMMGCEVNGPGEAMGADIGIAFGKGSGMLFKKGKVLKKVTIANAVKELLKNL